jgi:hypothetical protein
MELPFEEKKPTELQVIKQNLELLIAKAIDNRLSSKASGADAYVKRFAEYVVSIARHRAELAKPPADGQEAKAYDPLSIICLNWDVLLDNALNDALLADDASRGLYDPFGVVDYCCYVSSIEPENFRIRAGLWSLGCRGFNVKMLKIHGSMNWLQCSGCQRLYIEFGPKLNLANYTNAKLCRHCLKHGHSHGLRSSLIMPTFLKDLSNFQIKVVWHNTGVELMEARRLVFIGYSLPHADFEFRQLVARMIYKEAEIHVVLFDDNTDEGSRRYKEEVARYEQFFSGHKISFEPKGVLEYVKKL